MALSIRDHAVLKSAAERLEELISACAPRGPVHGVDPVLAANVTRKAKSLSTSLAKLREAADDVNHRPVREEPMARRKEPLSTRLYREPALSEVARAVSYGGKRAGQLRDRLDELSKRYGKSAVTSAFSELTMTDRATNLTVLTPEARRACWQLLGPAPEHPYYAEYWQGRTPPAEHQPPEAPPPTEEERRPAPPTENVTVHALSPAAAITEPEALAPASGRYDPSDEALEAFERLEEWLLDTRGRPTTEPAEKALRCLARALLEGKRAWHHQAEDALEVLKQRNGTIEGDDIPENNAPASESFQADLDHLLDCLHEVMLADRSQVR